MSPGTPSLGTPPPGTPPPPIHTHAPPHRTTRPHPPQYSRCTVGATLASPGTPPRPIHTHTRSQRATHPSRRRTTRLVNCAVPAPGVMNGAPTSYAAKQPTRNNVQPPQYSRRTVGATLVSPGTPPLGTPPPPIHTHTALNAQPDRSLSSAETRTGITNGPYGDRKNDTPARKNGDCSRQNWQGIHPKMRGNRKTFCLLTFFTPPIRLFHACYLILAHLPIRNQTPPR